jgi:hypothetical protein
VTAAFVIGYDPGGNNAHGVASLQVQELEGRWLPLALQVTTVSTLAESVEWIKNTCRDGRIVAAGVDTLTEWNSGPAGWRPADQWLRRTYPAIANKVVAPNALFGSMAVNGAAFLRLLDSRFRFDDTMVTEAHPKVCLYVLTGEKHEWAVDKLALEVYLLKEIGVAAPPAGFGANDHCFDASVGVLAALRGLNRDWTLDLHTLPTPDGVQFIRQTHYWWPPPPSVAPTRTVK